jgi:hypothetical protein
MEEALEPFPAEIAALDGRLSQDLDGAILRRQVARLVALDRLAGEIEQLPQLILDDRRGSALIGRDTVDRRRSAGGRRSRYGWGYLSEMASWSPHSL